MDDTYPDFRPIGLNVRSLLQGFVRRFPPYADFNVWNLLGWDTQGRAAYAFLNGNLVVRAKDYSSDRMVYSLLGTSQIDATCQVLGRLTAQLELVPEIVIQHIADPDRLRIEEEPDSCDYILSTERLVNPTGNSLYSIRVEVTRFPRLYPEHSVRTLDFRNAQDRADVIDLTRSWCRRKGFAECETRHETEIIERFMHLAPSFENVGVGLYLGPRMIGFVVAEVVGETTAIAHFAKSDLDYEGSSRYVVYWTARRLAQQGCLYLNYGEDAGIPGLRRAKLAYRPLTILRKYKVHFSHQTRAMAWPARP